MDDDDVGLRHRGQGRRQSQGHRCLPGVRRAGDDLDPRPLARQAVEQAPQLGTEAFDTVDRGGDNDVADEPGGDKAGRRPPQKADPTDRDEGLGDVGS